LAGEVQGSEPAVGEWLDLRHPTNATAVTALHRTIPLWRAIQGDNAMPFWLAFGISEEFEQGRGTSVDVRVPGWASFSDAVDSLAEVDVPVVAGRVIRAHAYVVEADTIQEASSFMRTVFIEHEVGPRVKLVQRDVRTQQMPPAPPRIAALSRVHGELCITHQITELALTLVQTPEHREKLDRHKVALEDLGYAVRRMRGDNVSGEPEGQRGRERLGYGYGQIGEAESATFPGMLASLFGELSIARHQVNLAEEVVSPFQAKELHGVGVELDRFRDTVSDLQLWVGPPA
jgi:hypothetical protein